MVTIREEQEADILAREGLLDEAYGACRFTKASATGQVEPKPDLDMLIAADNGVQRAPVRRAA